MTKAKPPKDISDAIKARGGPAVLAALKNAPPSPPVAQPAKLQVGPGANGSRPQAQPPGENVELVELARQAFDRPPANSTSSTNSPGGMARWEQPAPLPADSILADFAAFARTREEAADAFIAGAILPIAAALMGRSAWFQWGERRQHPNLFVMLAGKPGDRKSSIIGLGERLARMLPDPPDFLPSNFSPESMFDLYERAPDRLWIEDDANLVVTDWRQRGNGERNAGRVLKLYDCGPLAEAFKRNIKEQGGSPERTVPETSTSILFGVTFQACQFGDVSVRAGMARRFLYYVAERAGRIIVIPPADDAGEAMKTLAAGFARLRECTGPFTFDAEAERLWADFQHANRAECDSTDPLREAELSRLSSLPMQTLRLAMIFEAARWARGTSEWRGGIIRADTLQCAIAHARGCHEAARHLDTIGHRARIAEEAASVIARIRAEWRALASGGFIFATRSALTAKFCPHPDRAGSLKTTDLYERILPALEREGAARLILKSGKAEWFAFTTEPEA